MITPVILAGGTGSRLWPISRSAYPKQFIALASQQTMFQDTLTRLSNIPTTNPLVICNEEHRFLVAEQLRCLGLEGSIILEPEGRNTAPAIALSALLTLDGDPLLLVLPADHLIENVTALNDAIQKAAVLAMQGKMVTFGIVPTEAHTGYGYIKRGDELTDAYHVAQFVEKPNLITAQEYLQSDDFYWNSGMFLFKASCYLKELQKFRPDILHACQSSLHNMTQDNDFVRIDSEAFKASPAESIDYAVMENTEDAVVVPLDAGWNDIGAWSALWDVKDKDINNNAVQGDVILHDTYNSFVRSDNRLVATVGINDLIVVDTKDALLVASKKKLQDVKEIVATLKKSNRPESEIHREVYRPWGKYDAIDNGNRHLVKRITVNPGEKLSLQMHHHRAEHWIVVSGTARVTNGDMVFLLTENESTYIPIGAKHSLENPGKVVLEMIEVQSGSYLGEDDILRFEDRYGRLASLKKTNQLK